MSASSFDLPPGFIPAGAALAWASTFSEGVARLFPEVYRQPPAPESPLPLSLLLDAQAGSPAALAHPELPSAPPSAAQADEELSPAPWHCPYHPELPASPGAPCLRCGARPPT